MAYSYVHFLFVCSTEIVLKMFYNLQKCVEFCPKLAKLFVILSKINVQSLKGKKREEKLLAIHILTYLLFTWNFRKDFGIVVFFFDIKQE